MMVGPKKGFNGRDQSEGIKPWWQEYERIIKSGDYNGLNNFIKTSFNAWVCLRLPQTPEYRANSGGFDFSKWKDTDREETTCTLNLN